MATPASVTVWTVEPAQRVPARPGLDPEQCLHQRLGQGAAGGDEGGAVEEPGAAHHDELGAADRGPRQRLALAFEGGDAELDHRHDHDQRERDPQRVGVDVAARTPWGEIGGEEHVGEGEHDPQQEQPGLPQRQHRGGPGVGGRASDDVAERIERIREAGERERDHGGTPGQWPGSWAVSQGRQPASSASAVPGQVEGAGAGGGPGAIIQRPSVQVRRSQWAKATWASCR